MNRFPFLCHPEAKPRDLRFRGPVLETRNTMHKSIVILSAPLPMTWGRVRACSPKMSVFAFPGKARGTAVAPNEQTKSVVPHLRRSTTCLMDPALPGWADFWCRPSGPGLQIPLSHVHSSLNLPQASRLLGMTKEKATVHKE
jgi:hypothetical protein